MHERIRERILGSWGRFAASHPLVTLAVCVPLALACMVLTLSRLEFRADRSDLIDPGRDWNRHYHVYKENFPRANEDVVVVLDGEPGDPEIDALARSIADRLRADPRFDAADAGFDAAAASPRLYLMGSRVQFDRALDELAAARSVARSPHANAALDAMLARLAAARDAGELDAADGAAALGRLDQALAPYLAAVSGSTPDFSFLNPVRGHWQPLASDDGMGRLRYVRVHMARPDHAANGVNQIGATLAWLRTMVGQVVARSARPDTAWGVTGIPAIESDETTEAIRDSTIASVLSFFLITALMAVALRGLRVPLLAATSLLVGMAWSCGWLTLTVGHLQLLSVVFFSILLGLGIDFALLYVARLELIQDEHRNLASATSRVYRSVGPGMVTGAVTTAAAFAAVAFTDFKGMAEMGLIASGGIILCLVAVLSVFPALLSLTGRWKEIVRHRPGGETAHFAGGRLDVVDRRPIATLVVAGAVAVALGALAFRVDYDPNVLNLQSVGVESVDWEMRVVEEDTQSAWYAVVVAQPEEAPRLASRLRNVPEVSALDGMARLFPADLDERLAAIAAVRDRVAEASSARGGIPALLEKLQEVEQGLAGFARLAPAGLRERLAATAGRIDEARAAAGRLSGGQRDGAWRELDRRFLEARDGLAARLDAALAPGPLAESELPPILRDLWVGRDGSWQIQVHPAADALGRSILDPARLGPFVVAIRAALEDTGASVIGPPVQIYESSRLIKHEYIKAAFFALIAIAAVLLLDFLRPLDALCAMVPVAVGFVGTFGLMGIVGVPLNFANIIVLPIIFGIGVNEGVHVVHRWRLEPFGQPRGLSGGTGRGITLTMVTTMIGFGCLLVSDHRGVRSLGVVMVMGLCVTLLACYTVLPAVLRLRSGAPAPAQTELPRRMIRAAAAARSRRPAGARG